MQLDESPINCKSCNRLLPAWCCGYCRSCYDELPSTCSICENKFNQHSPKCAMYVADEDKEVNKAMPKITPSYSVGAKVEKVGGDYTFVGIVVAAFYKLNGTALRYVVEDDRGVLHVYSEKNLKKVW